MSAALFYDQYKEHSGKVCLCPVKCADGLWRWCVVSFEDVDEKTPGLVGATSPDLLYSSTDKMEHPELYGE